MNNLPLPKKPKMEPLTIEEEEEKQKSNTNKGNDNNHHHNNTNNNSNMLIEEMRSEQEEALVALIEHRAKEVEHLRNRITYYKSQLDEAERRLEQTKLQLARHRGLDNANTSKISQSNGTKEIKVERRSASPAQISERSSQNHPHMKEIKVERRSASPAQITEGSSQNHPQSKPRIDQGNEKFSRRSAGPLQINEGSSANQSKSRPQLATPAVNPRTPQPIKSREPEAKVPTVSGSRPSTPVPCHANSLAKAKVEKSQKELAVEVQPKGTKRKLEQKEHTELIPLIRSSSSPWTIRCQTGCLISSQHKRKLRSLILCPTNDQLFVTSALDGVVNLWQLQGKGSNANRLSSTECVSARERRWPEDIAWHPEGNSLFSVYSADGGDSQLSILNLNKTKEKARVSYLEEKPHVKGIINNIIFMPWDDLCFVTGGSDHAVVLWTDKDGEDSWKPRALHRNLHSSAVMGVAGMQHKRTVLSVGADKRIIGYDLVAGRYEYKHQIESKCMSVLTNPCDFNLFMVQTGTPERQLRLFDIRLRQTEIHAFGWKQESSESQSALINQAWSPDGLYLTSGSADPVIHIFDIRYNARKPSQSVKAHQKRVFKAAWHYAFPLLISISSDLNIGLHKII